MKIALEDMVLNEEGSVESTAFYATLVVDGVQVGFAGNGGRGEPTFYRSNNAAGQRLIRAVELYCASLPPKVYPPARPQDRPVIVQMNLTVFIDELVFDHLVRQDLDSFNRVLEAEMVHGIIFGIPGREFQAMRYVMPIGTLCRHRQGREMMKRDIHAKVLPLLREGRVILNKNVPERVKVFFELPVGAWVVI